MLTAALCGLFSLHALYAEGKPRGGERDRKYWVETMIRIVGPVYENLSRETLRKNMPVETNEGYATGKRVEVSHLEALGRSFCGIAPWLNLPVDDTKEGKLRQYYLELAVRSLANAVDPASPDYMPFDGPGSQPLVDAAFLAHGLLRSKDRVWPSLDSLTRDRLIVQMKASRRIKAHMSNWLMFSAIIEAALLEFTGECQMDKITLALDKHTQWYKGDGWYGDGPAFHLDYYNSYVIQPMLTDVLAVLRSKDLDKSDLYGTQLRRIVRYAEQQEKLISPHGVYPVLGRSMGYRYGAFQALAQVALMKELPGHIAPAQVRCALTAVLKKQTVKDTFDSGGWLTLGFCGHQPEIAESYVSTGSAYLCAAVFLPLGLPADDHFWSDPPAEWSSVKAWSGKKMRRDGAIK